MEFRRATDGAQREGRARGNGDRPEDGGWHEARTPDVSAPAFAPAHPACLPAPSPGGRKQALEVGGQWGEEGSGFAGTAVMRTSLTPATAGGRGRWAGGSGASKNQTFSSRGERQAGIRQEPGGQGKPGPWPVVVPGEGGLPNQNLPDTPPLPPRSPGCSQWPEGLSLQQDRSQWPCGIQPLAVHGEAVLLCAHSTEGKVKPRRGLGRQAGDHIGGNGARGRRAPL